MFNFPYKFVFNFITRIIIQFKHVFITKLTFIYTVNSNLTYSLWIFVNDALIFNFSLPDHIGRDFKLFIYSIGEVL